MKYYLFKQYHASPLEAEAVSGLYLVFKGNEMCTLCTYKFNSS